MSAPHRMTVAGTQAFLYRHGQKLAVPSVLLVFVVYLGFANPLFVSLNNFTNIASSVSPIAIVAMGMALLLISGNFDLSVGGIGALGVVAGSMVINHLGTGLGIAVLLLLGLACGMLNGIIVTLIGVNSLVATLGTGYIFSGIASVLAGSSPIILASNTLPDAITYSVGGIPVSVIVMLAVIVIAYWYSRTVGGQSLYAIGANREAARLAGVPVRLVAFIPFALTGLFAGVASIITIAFIGGGDPSTGTDWPLEAIAAAVVGGISITGGEGSIFAAVVGMALIGVVQNGLVLLNINSSLQTVILGVIIIAAVAADVRFRRFGGSVGRRRRTRPSAGGLRRTAGDAPTPGGEEEVREGALVSQTPKHPESEEEDR